MELTQQQIERYGQDGFLVVEKFFDGDELAQLVQTTQELKAEAEAGNFPAGRRSELADVVQLPDGARRLRRIASPDLYHPVYDRIMRHPRLVQAVGQLLGGSVRFDHAKLNFKPPLDKTQAVSSSTAGVLEWHQDWAFYPHTNDDMLAVGIMLTDNTAENAPLQVIPGSHREELFDHHEDGYFVGGVRPDKLRGLGEQAVSCIAPAGSIEIHHVRTLHSSGSNYSDQERPLLLLNYVAVDAFPVFHSYDWNEFDSRILLGESTQRPRVTQVPIRVPLPVRQKDEDAYGQYISGSIYDSQAEASWTDEKAA